MTNPSTHKRETESMTDAARITRKAEELIMDALRAADAPLGVAAILKAVRDQTNVRMPHPTAHGALDRLRKKSLAAYVDDPGHPRRWFAIAE
jgi:hypothetical protein